MVRILHYNIHIKTVSNLNATWDRWAFVRKEKICTIFTTNSIDPQVAVGPKRLTNRNLKQIISIECTKTVIFQLLWPIDISKLAKRELIQ